MYGVGVVVSSMIRSSIVIMEMMVMLASVGGVMIVLRFYLFLIYSFISLLPYVFKKIYEYINYFQWLDSAS